MAVIDSRTPGALSVLSSTGTDDPTNALRSFVAVTTGLTLQNVRARWTPKPGTRPNLATTWAAVGVTEVKTHGTPYSKGTKGDISVVETGTQTKESHQTLKVVASFYGPNAYMLSDQFRESCYIAQDNDLLRESGYVIQGVDEMIIHAPEFVFEQWCDRYDVVFRVGRKVTRTYGVRTLASADSVTIHTEKGTL